MASEPSGKKFDVHHVSADQVHQFSKEKPWLLPSNRKLRSLNGVSLRNLSLQSLSARSHGQTIDDDSLPTTLHTQAKLLAKRETHKLGQSRSSDDLPAHASSGESSKSQASNGVPSGAPRPLKERLRRRSTLNWTNESSEARQKKLEGATAGHMAETWFSLHCEGVEEPIYISEVADRSMNPSFGLFDLNMFGSKVTRQDQLTVKFWAKSDSASSFFLLIDLRVNLRSLQFIGRSLENYHHALPPNCILFHLSDGVYTSFTDLPLEEVGPSLAMSSKPSQTILPTSSFDALMRLSNLDDCIQDALSTRDRLATQIGHLLTEQKASRSTLDSALQVDEQLASTKRALTICRKQVKNAETRRTDLEASLKTRRAAIASGSLAQEKAKAQFSTAPVALSAASAQLRSSKAALSGQIRRICEDLLTIYPIESIDPKSLSYTIRGIQLPNANTASPHPETDPAATSAALGLVAHITQLLSLYLSIPIPYPPTPHGSTSTIFDPISISMPSVAARTFPLYQTGAVTYRFEYGVFLLNSDIELLMSRQGAKLVDLRHTLPNLKYILTVLTTGKGAVPSRKKGGVRALENGSPLIQSKVQALTEDTPVKERHANGQIPAI